MILTGGVQKYNECTQRAPTMWATCAYLLWWGHMCSKELRTAFLLLCLLKPCEHLGGRADTPAMYLRSTPVGQIEDRSAYPQLLAVFCKRSGVDGTLWMLQLCDESEGAKMALSSTSKAKGDCKNDIHQYSFPTESQQTAVPLAGALSLANAGSQILYKGHCSRYSCIFVVSVGRD